MTTTPIVKTSSWSPQNQAQGESQEAFRFTEENRAKLNQAIARYPEGRAASAVLWALYLAQDQNGGWLSNAAIAHVAETLAMAPIRVQEVARFYTMLNTENKGRWRVQVCRTTPCWLRGSDAITAACLKAAGVSRLGEVSADGTVSVEEVECLGGCCNAPLMQINDRNYYEDLTPERASEIVRGLREDTLPEQSGSQTGRTASEPVGSAASTAASNVEGKA